MQGYGMPCLKDKRLEYELISCIKKYGKRTREDGEGRDSLHHHSGINLTETRSFKIFKINNYFIE